MLDLFDLPGVSQPYVTEFIGTGDWKTWIKPRGISFVQIFCMGAGGGGGGGRSGAAGVSRRGGGGGASGGISSLTVPAFLLPDMIYVLAGLGGAGGTAGAPGTNGGTGGISYVGLTASTTSSELILVSSATAAGGGVVGGATTGGTGGAIGTSPARANAPFCCLGIFYMGASATAGAASGAISAPNGSVGGSQTTGVCFTENIRNCVNTGGAGGGSVSTNNIDFAGGNINGSGYHPVLAGGAAATKGADGIRHLKPMFFMGGAGGGSSGASGTGGNGGNGDLGCGGGGAGSGVTGGRGGAGGNGLVIITCY